MANEREILRLEAERLEQDGYTVALEPSPAVLPEEFKSLRPDAVAVGKEPRLLIEVISGDPESSARAQKTREIISGSPGWKLHIIYLGAKPSTKLSPFRCRKSTKPSIRCRQSRPKIQKQLLMVCWACLEALARALQPGTFSRAQTPGRIVEQLAGISYVTASTAEFLRRMAGKRNEFVHGQLLTEVDLKDIDRFLAILHSLVEEARAENVP